MSNHNIHKSLCGLCSLAWTRFFYWLKWWNLLSYPGKGQKFRPLKAIKVTRPKKAKKFIKNKQGLPSSQYLRAMVLVVFCPAPKVRAYFGRPVTKSLDSLKWHWLILVPMGALENKYEAHPIWPLKASNLKFKENIKKIHLMLKYIPYRISLSKVIILLNLFMDFRPFNWKILVKSIN